MRNRKYDYLFVVQGNYGFGHGWEDLCASTVRSEARANLKDYLLNEGGFPHRMIQRRVLREAASSM